MAQKRMFDRAIIDTDRFMELSMTSKALYFLLGMEADDEGFVSYKKVLRIHGGNEDDMRILAIKNFIIPFESGVVVITDWQKNNWLDSRRKRPTEYQKELKLLSLTDNKEYVLSNGLAPAKPVERRGEERSTEEKSTVQSIAAKAADGFEEFWSLYPRKEAKGRAMTKWARLKPDVRAKIMADLPLRKAGEKWTKENGRFVEHAATYLNGSRWEDAIEPAREQRQKQKSTFIPGL